MSNVIISQYHYSRDNRERVIDRKCVQSERLMQEQTNEAFLTFTSYHRRDIISWGFRISFSSCPAHAGIPGRSSLHTTFHVWQGRIFSFGNPESGARMRKGSCLPWGKAKREGKGNGNASHASHEFPSKQINSFLSDNRTSRPNAIGRPIPGSWLTSTSEARDTEKWPTAGSSSFITVQEIRAPSNMNINRLLYALLKHSHRFHAQHVLAFMRLKTRTNHLRKLYNAQDDDDVADMSQKMRVQTMARTLEKQVPIFHPNMH